MQVIKCDGCGKQIKENQVRHPTTNPELDYCSKCMGEWARLRFSNETCQACFKSHEGNSYLLGRMKAGFCGGCEVLKTIKV